MNTFCAYVSHHLHGGRGGQNSSTTVYLEGYEKMAPDGGILEVLGIWVDLHMDFEVTFNKMSLGCENRSEFLHPLLHGPEDPYIKGVKTNTLNDMIGPYGFVFSNAETRPYYEISNYIYDQKPSLDVTYHTENYTDVTFIWYLKRHLSKVDYLQENNRETKLKEEVPEITRRMRL